MDRKKTALCVVVGIILGLTLSPVSAQWIQGDLWSLLDDTIVLTNQSCNVHIGSNATTDSQLRVSGNTTFNGSINLVSGTGTFGKSVTFNDDVYFSAGSRINYDHATVQTWVTDTKNWQCAPVPVGGIIMWGGSTIPQGWYLCDGTSGTPDLRGRFILGSNSTLALNSTGGASTVTITNATMPAHYHTYNAFGTGTLVTVGGGTRGQVSANTGTTGSGLPHSNLPPYYILAFIQYRG